MRAWRAALPVAALVLAAGCTDADTEGGPALGRLVPGPAIELTRSGGCGDVSLWAADDAGSVVVTLVVDLADRSTTQPTMVEATLPDDEHGVSVEVLHGTDLTRNLCTDVIDAASEPTSTSPATEGRVEIEVDPPGECGETGATFRVSGLVADDGSTFLPIVGTAGDIGCVAG